MGEGRDANLKSASSSEARESSKRLAGSLPPRIFLAALLVAVFAWGIAAGSGRAFPYNLLVVARQAFDSELGSTVPVPPPSLEKLQAGGFILHMRHGHRVETEDVVLADNYEVASGDQVRYSRMTCLSEEGVHQAELTDWVFKDLNIEVMTVISTPSCRAEQHARIAFGRVDRIDARHLHLSMVPESQKAGFTELQRRALDDLLPLPDKGNIVIVGHSLAPYDCSVVRCLSDAKDRRQGGLSIIAYEAGEFSEVARFSRLYEFYLQYGKLSIPGLR